MIYFSELKGKKIFTEDQVYVGKLEDIIFQASESPSLLKIVVQDKLNNKLIIPIQHLLKISVSITIKKDYTTSELEENELFVMRNLLDKQIIDIKGSKIVRVNDVAIQDKGDFFIAGVDIGLLGIMRWLKLEEPLLRILSVFNIKLTSQFLSWNDIQPLELMRGSVKLRKNEEKLHSISPADLAGYLENTNVITAGKFLKILDEKKSAKVIERLNLNYRSALFNHYKAEKAARILGFINPDDAVDILLTLPGKKRLEILKLIPAEKQTKLKLLIQYSITPIGNLLTSEYITVLPDDKANDVIERIKKETEDFSYLNPIYVIDKEGKLVGVFNLHELILQDPETVVYKFMIQNVVVLHLTTPGEIAMKRMMKYKLASIPVIDTERVMLGMVTMVDLINNFSYKLT